ncbi:protein phosphatase 2C domain-containing protein [Halohasta salina]|uniref:protein phosphatase 2C domain-containing protein n=1 Tax=Halohasta salina TaxID=2961621 RepID=UPI0020A4EC78|nr:protein phosphatase 2C domain-containing protein [Halohasta salina]
MEVSPSKFNEPEVIGESVQGPGHKTNNIECQDNWSAKAGENYVVAAVGDGLGTASRSAEGSQLATKIAVKKLTQWLQSDEVDVENVSQSEAKDAFQSAIIHARKRIETVAAEFDNDLNQYHTTLSVVCNTPNWYAAIAIGDSGVVGITVDDTYRRLVDREDSSSSSATVPLTGSPTLVKEKNRFDFDQTGMQTVVLFSDGLDRFAWSLENKSEPRQEFFGRLQDFITHIDSLSSEKAKSDFREFVDSDEFHNYSSDDKTLVVAHLPQATSRTTSSPSGRKKFSDREFKNAVESAQQPSITEVGEIVGCSHTTAADRLRQLKQDGVLSSREAGNEILWKVDQSGE